MLAVVLIDTAVIAMLSRWHGCSTVGGHYWRQSSNTDQWLRAVHDQHIGTVHTLDTVPYTVWYI